MRKLSYSMSLCIVLLIAACHARGQETPAVTEKPATHEPTPDSSNAYQVGNGVSPPKLVHRVDAEFSEAARKKRISTTCVVTMIVDSDGHVTEARIIRSAAENQPAKLKAAAATLDDQALAAVQQYTFEAATLHGHPVAVHMNVEISFQIFK